MKTFADYGIIIPPGKSGEIDVMCPKCGGMNRTKRVNQKERTLSVNTIKGTWQCHHTGCEWKGYLERETDGPIYTVPSPLITVGEKRNDLYSWFSKRGISQEAVDACHVVTHKENGKTSIAFKHMRDGQHVHTAFRSARDKSFWQSSGTERIFYGLDDISADTTALIICEGHCDKLAWWDAGYPNTLSVSDGAGTGEGKMHCLSSAHKLMERMDTVYLAFDADDVGQTTMHEYARRIGVEKCRIVRYPDGCKDANDVLRDHGSERLADCILLSEPHPIVGIYNASDDAVFDRMTEYVAFGGDDGFVSGFENLDRLYTPPPGTVTIWTGISGHGKSTILNHYLIAVAKRQTCPFALFTPENMPEHKFLVKLSEILLHKRKSAFALSDLDLVRPFLAQNVDVIYPEEMTIDSILSLMRASILQRGTRMCVIDPWNMIESSRPKDISETEYVSEVMSKLSTFSKRSNVAVHLVAHPTKYKNYSGGDEEPKPHLNDIATSGNFRNKCDFGISVWRNIKDDTVPTEVTVEKVRDDDYGSTGQCRFVVDIPTRTITPYNNLTILSGGRIVKEA